MGRNKQRVVEQMPKTVQLGAYRRLAQVKPRRRLRDVSLREQGFEGYQQVQIDALSIHGVNYWT